jgi:hypothetical protein
VSLDVELPLAAVARRPKKRMDHHASGGGKCRGFECWSGAWDVRGQSAPGRDLTPLRVTVAVGFRPVGPASSRVVVNTAGSGGCACVCVCVWIDQLA